jgi:hypothetical protein
MYSLTAVEHLALVLDRLERARIERFALLLALAHALLLEPLTEFVHAHFAMLPQHRGRPP